MSCLTRQYSDVIFTLPSWDSLDELSSHHYRNELLNGRIPGSNPTKGKRLNLRSYPLTIHLAELVPTITLDFTMLYIDGFYNFQYMKILRSDGASTNELWIRTPPPENPCNAARGEKTQTRYSIAVNRKPPLGTGRVHITLRKRSCRLAQDMEHSLRRLYHV